MRALGSGSSGLGLFYQDAPGTLFGKLAIVPRGETNPNTGRDVGTFLIDASYTVTVTSIISPLVFSATPVGDSLESVRFDLSTFAPLEFMNPPGGNYTPEPGSPFWTFIPGDDIPERFDGRGGWDMWQCFNQRTCTIPTKSMANGRIQVWAYVEGQLVVGRSEPIHGATCSSNPSAVGCQQNRLMLTCDSTSIHRASTISCNAHAEPSSAALVVTGWSFEGDPREDTPLDGTTWSGPMVRSGTITVKGKVGGGSEQTASVSVTVLPRDWSNKTPDITAVRVPNGDPRTVPKLPEQVRWDHDLGHVLFHPENEEIAYVSRGPNSGYNYFADIFFKSVGYYSLNDEAFAPNSLFQRAQEPDRPSSGSSTRLGGINFCEQRDVPRQAARVERHEVEHVRVYRDAFTEFARSKYAELEALVSKDDQELNNAADALTRQGDKEASDESERVVDAANGPFVVRFTDSNGRPCAMKNTLGGILESDPTRH